MTDVGHSRRAFRQGLTLALLALGLHPAMACTAPAASESTVTIRGRALPVEIVRTSEAQARGLGGRESLEWDRGMLFPYEESGFPVFWMHDMRFDIDIVWIRDERIVSIAHRVPHPPDPRAEPVRVRPPELVNMVLEVPAGYARARGWARGDRAEVRALPPDELPAEER